MKYTIQKTVKWPLVESIYGTSSLDITGYVLGRTHDFFKGLGTLTDNTVTPIRRQLDMEVK